MSSPMMTRILGLAGWAYATPPENTVTIVTSESTSTAGRPRIVVFIRPPCSSFSCQLAPRPRRRATESKPARIGNSLRQRALAEDDESLAVAGDRRRHLSGAFMDEHAPSALALGAAQDHLAVRMVHVPDRRLHPLRARLRVQVTQLHRRRIDLEDGGEIHSGRGETLAPALRPTVCHRRGGAD